MKYLGGKSKLAKKIAPFLEGELQKGSGVLYEPFMGSFNIVPALGDSLSEAFCSDIHLGLVSTMQAIQRGWSPPESITEEEYADLRIRNNPLDPRTAFAAFGCSFGGKEWGGYARSGKRNYAGESRRNLLGKKKAMSKVIFSAMSFHQVTPSLGSVVYCDPPYQGTTGYRTGTFDHDGFFSWCERQAARGAAVFVSEFTRPNREGWEVVEEIPRTKHVSGSTGSVVDLLIRLQ